MVSSSISRLENYIERNVRIDTAKRLDFSPQNVTFTQFRIGRYFWIEFLKFNRFNVPSFGAFK